MESNYPQSFIDLLDSKHDYIGQGNPNSKILIVGREHGFVDERQCCLEIWRNKEQWKQIIQGIPFCEDGYSPRTCFTERGQEFRLDLNSKHGGVSPTWYIYQMIVNTLCPHKMPQGKRAPLLDFFNYSFITEFSTASRPNNNNPTDEEKAATRESIEKRTPLLSSEFYRSFPIVILACGIYFDDYNIDIQTIFNVKWEGPTVSVQLDNGKRIWLNLHYSEDRKRIVIHTWQASGICRQGVDNLQSFLDYLFNINSFPREVCDKALEYNLGQLEFLRKSIGGFDVYVPKPIPQGEEPLMPTGLPEVLVYNDGVARYICGTESFDYLNSDNY